MWRDDDYDYLDDLFGESGDKEYGPRGIDWTLRSALNYNTQSGFDVRDIEKVLAVYWGENDGNNWAWILELKSGKFVQMQGGCDYSGWD